MKVSMWCRCYYRIYDRAFYKKLDNEKFHTECIRIEDGASTILDASPFEIYVTRQDTGERNNPIGIVFRYSTRVNRVETCKEAITRCEREGLQKTGEWCEIHKNDIPNY